MTKIIVNGAAGRMGTTIIRLAAEDPDIMVVGAVDRSDSPHLGKDAGEFAGVNKLDVNIADNLKEVISLGDLIIDFSSPDYTTTLLDVASAEKKAVVIGTTGQSDEQKESFKKTSREIPLLVSPNMCVGVNLLWKIAETAAQTLKKEYQVNIVERHHIHKKDAPSGTAKRLIQIVTDATGHDMDRDVFYSLNGSPEITSPKPITVESIREGEVVGDHTLYFTSKEDRIELSHCAFTRDIFGKGALRAAKWIVDKPAGLYDMQDVLFRA